MILNIEAEIKAFEDASHEHYLSMRKAGLVIDDSVELLPKESLFWRKEDGSYGVASMNAAWWGWFNRALAQAQMSMNTQKH